MRNEILDEVIQMISSKTQNSFYRVPMADVGKRLIAEVEKMKEETNAAADSVHHQPQPGDFAPALGQVAAGS